jgi:hypothetical protein
MSFSRASAIPNRRDEPLPAGPSCCPKPRRIAYHAKVLGPALLDQGFLQHSGWQCLQYCVHRRGVYTDEMSVT